MSLGACALPEAEDSAPTVTYSALAQPGHGPVIQLPSKLSAVASSADGASVHYRVSAFDEEDGAVAVTCVPRSGDLFELGTTAVTCSARDSDGNRTEIATEARVAYAWTDVLQPLDPNRLNLIRRGRVVSVRFRFVDASAGISDAAAALYVAPVIEGLVGAEQPARSIKGEDLGPWFHYRSDNDRYFFLWATSGHELGLHQLRIELGDGVKHTFDVKLVE